MVVEGLRELRLNPETDLSRGPWPEIIRVLRSDGFEIHNGSLVHSVGGTPEADALIGVLEARLDELGWDAPLLHLKQARENLTLGYWEAANAALRSFLQGVFDSLAETVSDYPPKGLEPGGKRRMFLEKQGVFSEDEGRLVQALFAVLNTKGPHPGTSDEGDCVSRLMLATGVAWRVLARG
jgi:hypothetical protein